MRWKFLKKRDRNEQPCRRTRRKLAVEGLESRRLLDAGGGAFGDFEPVPASVFPTTSGGNPEQPFVLATGFSQTVFAREPDGGTFDLWDMNTQNETGRQAGRFLYRSHEVRSSSQVSVTDLETVRRAGSIVTSDTKVLAQRADWERFDGIVWTPWGTILVAEETVVSSFPDPEVPQAKAGLIYELFLDKKDPTKLDLTKGGGDGIAVRPAIGSRSHEGLRFDSHGNLYGISESSPPGGGYIYKFTPDRKGDLSSGQLFALKITRPVGAVADRTGEAIWVPLDRAAVQVNSDTVATAAGATGYGRPEDVEIGVGGNRQDPCDGETLFVAITSEDRVIAIDLEFRRDDDHSHRAHSHRGQTVFVSDYVRVGLNVSAEFDSPDNLALDSDGNLFITEDPGGLAPKPGDDIWAATPPADDEGGPAEFVRRFASLTDGDAEPTGIYFDIKHDVLYVNVQHRGGDRRDLAVAITPNHRFHDDHDRRHGEGTRADNYFASYSLWSMDEDADERRRSRRTKKS